MPRDWDARREYQRKWVAKRRQEYMDRFGGCCQRCKCTIDLEFHHKYPLIKVTHRIFSYSRKRIEAELVNCELLCRKPCHRLAQNEISKPRNFCGL
jgi:hypothetical protein